MKAEIVLESCRDGVSVADVARKHGVSAPQLHSWRRAARDGVLAMPDDDMLGLVPVVVEAGGGDGGHMPPDAPGTIVLEIDEGGQFQWPRPAGGMIKLTPAQFSALFEGLDWKAIRAERRWQPRLAG